MPFYYADVGVQTQMTAAGLLTEAASPSPTVYSNQTLQAADQIAVLEAGRVVELGSHDELAQKEGGEYMKLINSQSLSLAR